MPNIKTSLQPHLNQARVELSVLHELQQLDELPSELQGLPSLRELHSLRESQQQDPEEQRLETLALRELREFRDLQYQHQQQQRQEIVFQIAQHNLTQTRMSELRLREQTYTIDSPLVCGLSYRKIAIICGIVLIITISLIIICSIKYHNLNSTRLTQRNITTIP